MSIGLSAEDRQPLLTSSMSRPTEDPFYKIRDEVRGQSETVKARHEKFQELVKNCDTSTSAEFKALRSGLVKDVRAIDKKLKVLNEAVEMVEKNRGKFAHIKDAELASRKRFVTDTQEILASVKGGMESTYVRRKMEDDENKARRESFENSATALNPSSNSNSIERENDRFIKDQQQQAKLMMREQDVQLDALGQAVGRLDQISKDVNQELKEQNVMLDHLETDMDSAGNKMDTVMGQLNKLLKSKDGCQIWTIVILALILVILIALLIWT